LREKREGEEKSVCERCKQFREGEGKFLVREGGPAREGLEWFF